MPPYEVNVEKIVFYLRWFTHPYTNRTVVSYAVYRLPTLTVDEGVPRTKKAWDFKKSQALNKHGRASGI